MSKGKQSEVKKRILFIDHDQGRSGSTVSLEYLVQAFSNENYHVFVLTPKHKSEAKPLLDAGALLLAMRSGRFITINLSTHFTNTRSLFSWKGMLLLLHEMLKFFWGIVVVAKAIRETSPQLVYVNEHVALQASIAARFSRTPAVIHVRSLLLKGAFGLRRHLASRLILSCNQAVFAITRSEADQLCPLVQERDKIKLIGEFFSETCVHSIDVKRSKDLFGLPKNKQVVTMLGGIGEDKGTLVFLKSATVILPKIKDVLFVIAGKNHRESAGIRAYSDQCLQIIEILRQKDSICVFGEITNSLELIAASDIVVSPSMKTHFSRPVIEAWGFEKPVVASRTEHMQNLIVDGVNGMLFDIGDEENLASCLCRLLTDKELCMRLGVEGKKKVREEFDAEKNLSLIIDECDAIVRRQRS